MVSQCLAPCPLPSQTMSLPLMDAGRLWLISIRWSLATALTPFAAQMGLPALLVVRAMMGIGEGVAMPAMNNMLSRYI